MSDFIKVTDYYHHISNGGILVEFGYYEDDDIKTNSVKISTGYNGYTCICSELCGNELSPSVLREIGEKFMQFAWELEKE